MDELAAVLDAAAEQDVELAADAPTDAGPTAKLVRAEILKGLRPGQIAAKLGI